MSFKKSETPPALPSDEVMKTAFASMDYVSLCELYSFLSISCISLIALSNLRSSNLFLKQ